MVDAETDADIDALFEGEFADEDEDDFDFLAAELAEENDITVEVPDLDHNTPSSVSTTSTGSLSPPATLFGLHLPRPSSSTTSATHSSTSSSAGGSRQGSIGGTRQGAHEPLAGTQNVGTTALSVSPATAAKTAPSGASYPVPSSSAIDPAHLGMWLPKARPRPWPRLPGNMSVPQSVGPRSPGYLASQKKIFGSAGLIARLDPATPFRPAGSSSDAAIDLTRPRIRPAKRSSRASSVPAAPVEGPESRKALETLPPALLQALSALLTDPPILPPDLHQLLHSFLHPNPVGVSYQPSLAHMMFALQAYLPALKQSDSRASTPSGGILSRSPTPRNVGIGRLPRAAPPYSRSPIRQDSVLSDASAATHTTSSTNTPQPSIPIYHPSFPPTTSTNRIRPGGRRPLRDLRAELEAHRDEIARVYTQAKVRLRDLQVEESVLENTRKRLKANEAKRTEKVHEAVPMPTESSLDVDLGDLEDILTWAGVVQQPPAGTFF